MMYDMHSLPGARLLAQKQMCSEKRACSDHGTFDLELFYDRNHTEKIAKNNQEAIFYKISLDLSDKHGLAKSA